MPISNGCSHSTAFVFRIVMLKLHLPVDDLSAMAGGIERLLIRKDDCSPVLAVGMVAERSFGECQAGFGVGSGQEALL